MGNRVLVQFKIGGEVSPVIYGHWCGSDAPERLVSLRKQMEGRDDDLNYVAARCVQQFIAGDTSQTGFGIWNADGELTAEHSHGDAGIFIVELGRTWKIKNIGTRREVQFPIHKGIEWSRG